MKYGNETIKRLAQAFMSDKYVQQLQEQMQKIIAYSAMPFGNQVPYSVNTCIEMVQQYKEHAYSFLCADKGPQSDLAVATGYYLMAQRRMQLLSTKYRSKKSVLECIDDRLQLYIVYQKAWILNTDWEQLHPIEMFFKSGWLFSPPEPYMTFPQWLYRYGYEALLSDEEFIESIEYCDKDRP